MVPNWLQCRREINQGAKLAYARLAQFAGKDGACFPKQATLAVELGVSERTANEYVRTLVRFGLIEKDRPGRGLSNRYFFLDHPWICECQLEAPSNSVQERQEPSAPARKNSSGQEQQETSAPCTEENQENGDSDNRLNKHRGHADGIPHSLEDAVKVARQLGIEEEFTSKEFNRMVSVGWLDGCRRAVISWSHYLKQRWSKEQSERGERRATGPRSAKRPPSPPRRFSSSDYDQPV